MERTIALSYDDKLIDTLTDDVANAIIANKLVLFIGAGFAMNLNMPSWKHLINNLLVKHSPKDEQKKVKIQNLINYGYLTDAVEEIASCSYTPPNEFKKEIAFEFRSNPYLKEDENLNLLYQYLLDLYKCGATKIVTTNYDNSIELKLKISRRNILSPNANLNNIEDIRKEILTDNYYLKLHGGVDAPETMVLFEKDYRDRYILNDEIPLLLQELFTHNRILFIGCGLADRYMDIYEKLKVRDAVMNSYVICRDDDLKWIADRNGIIRIPIKSFSQLPQILYIILEKIRQKRIAVSKKILFSDVPLETYDYNTAKCFFDQIRKSKVVGCYFFNTQVEFSSWFTPSLQLHLSQQMDACSKHKKQFEQFRIVFLPYDYQYFREKIMYNNKKNIFFQDIKAMLKIHQFMHCRLAFISSDVLKNIIKEHKSFFITNNTALGLDGLDMSNFSNLEDILKTQTQNGFHRKNDLDFSVVRINQNDPSESRDQVKIWQANLEDEDNMFKYVEMKDSNKDIYAGFYNIIINYVRSDGNLFNPRITKNKKLYDIMEVNYS